MTKTMEKPTETGLELAGIRESKSGGMPTSGLFVITGDVKTAKSSFAADFPDSYVFMAERHNEHVGGRVHELKDLTEFRKYLPAVIKEPSIKTIVIDTIDAIGEWMAQEVAAKFGLTHINETKKGVDGFEKWGTLDSKLKDLITYLNDCGKLVILCAHYKPAKLDSLGNVAEPAKIALPVKASASFIAYHAKIIGYTYKNTEGENTRYFMTFKGGPLGQWGSRVDEVQDKTIELPKENPYSAFAALFNK